NTTSTQIYTLSLHDALPIFTHLCKNRMHTISKSRGNLKPSKALNIFAMSLLLTSLQSEGHRAAILRHILELLRILETYLPKQKKDRKSTRLNSSHVKISYAV